MKGGRSRIVPLWWDAGTLGDLAAWKLDRVQSGAEADQPFLASLIPRPSCEDVLPPHAPQTISHRVQGCWAAPVWNH